MHFPQNLCSHLCIISAGCFSLPFAYAVCLLAAYSQTFKTVLVRFQTRINPLHAFSTEFMFTPMHHLCWLLLMLGFHRPAF